MPGRFGRMGSGVCDRADAMHAQPELGTMRAVSGQCDLAGYSSTQETKALGLLAVQAHLVRHGFKVTEVSGRSTSTTRSRSKSPTSRSFCLNRLSYPATY